MNNEQGNPYVLKQQNKYNKRENKFKLKVEKSKMNLHKMVKKINESDFESTDKIELITLAYRKFFNDTLPEISRTASNGVYYTRIPKTATLKERMKDFRYRDTFNYFAHVEICSFKKDIHAHLEDRDIRFRQDVSTTTKALYEIADEYVELLNEKEAKITEDYLLYPPKIYDGIIEKTYPKFAKVAKNGVKESKANKETDFFSLA